MPRLLVIVAVIAVIFWVFSIVDVSAQPASRHRGVAKPVWVLLTVIFPVIGGVLWFAIGRVSARDLRVVAPDDDVEFLRGLGGGTTTTSTSDGRGISAQDERIRRLEQELARLDDDDDPPARPGRGR